MNTLKSKRAAGFIAILLATPLAAAAANSYVYGNVSSWTVRTDPGQAYRCFAEVEYEGGTAIRIGYNTSEAGLYLSVSDTALRIVKAGAVVKAVLSFDDATRLEMSGTGVEADGSGARSGIMLPVPADARQSFLQNFMAGHTMTVAVDGSGAIDLSLAGSARAVRLLDDCQVTMSSQGLSGS